MMACHVRGSQYHNLLATEKKTLKGRTRAILGTESASRGPHEQVYKLLGCANENALKAGNITECHNAQVLKIAGSEHSIASISSIPDLVE